VAAISVTPAKVRYARAESSHFRHAPSNAALTRGTVVVLNSSGKWIAGNGGGTQQPYVLLHTVSSANVGVTAVGGPGAILEVGDSLPAIGASVYATAAGGLDDNATGTQKIGEVISVGGQAFGDAAKKLLQLT
jgi:hypothetical protein